MVHAWFRSYVLSRLEYCAPVWVSAASEHLRLLDAVVRRAEALCGRRTLCCLDHRRRVSVLCMLYKIFQNVAHPLNSLLTPFVYARLTRAAVAAHEYCLTRPRHCTEQYRRSFLPRAIELWNELDAEVFESGGLCGFKRCVNARL